MTGDECLEVTTKLLSMIHTVVAHKGISDSDARAFVEELVANCLAVVDGVFKKEATGKDQELNKVIEVGN